MHGAAVPFLLYFPGFSTIRIGEPHSIIQKIRKKCAKKLYVNHDLSQVLQGLKINIFEKTFDQEHLHFYSSLALCEPLA